MKRFVHMCAAIGAGLFATAVALAVEPQLAPPEAPQASPAANKSAQPRSRMAGYFEDAEKKSDGSVKTEEKVAAEEPASNDSSCGCDSSSCGDEAPSCGEEANGCGDSCGGCKYCFCEDWGTMCCVDNTWPFCCCCKPGDPCTLQKHLTPCCTDVTYAGFAAVGYHSQNTGLSVNDGDRLDLNDTPGDVNLNQLYFYVEKKAKTDSCCCDWGYRWDVVYGTQAFAAQANGNQNNGWDKLWDHGIYGWAMPQAYIQLGYNDWDIKMGHFYTPMGYEVFPATGNFFYSHSYSWFNSEPITHTGVMGAYKANECTTYTVGYTTGWDTAFDAFDGGSDFMGGISQKLNDSVTLTYMCMVGNFGFRSDGEFGYEHTIVFDAKLSSKWQYVMENDFVDTQGTFGGNGVTDEGQDIEIANYLFYTINDCWKMGTRFEWWKSNQVTGENTSFFELTYGFNYKPNANWVVRPEVRYDWTPAEDSVADAQGKDDFNKVIFGIDAIVTF